MMNVKFVRVKVTKSEFFSFFFFFRKFLTSSCHKKRDARLDKNDECGAKGRKREKKENAETRRKELCKKKRKYTSSRSPTDIRFSNCY